MIFISVVAYHAWHSMTIWSDSDLGWRLPERLCDFIAFDLRRTHQSLDSCISLPVPPGPRRDIFTAETHLLCLVLNFMLRRKRAGRKFQPASFVLNLPPQAPGNRRQITGRILWKATWSYRLQVFSSSSKKSRRFFTALNLPIRPLRISDFNHFSRIVWSSRTSGI